MTAGSDPGTNPIGAALADNEVTGKATDAVRALFDGDVTGTDLSDLWSYVGWPIVKVILLIIAVLIIAGWARRFAVRGATKVKVEATLAKFLGNIARWTVMVLGGITILQTFGIEATSFAAVLAALGFAVGMALSGTLGNIAAGVMLLIFRPFRIGDYVKTADAEGQIDEIGLFTTTLDTLDNRRIIVPNGSIFGANIENLTFHPERRCDVNVGVDYGADISKTRDVLVAAAKTVPQSLADPEPAAVLTGLGDSAVDWQVRVWVKTADYWPASDALTEAIKRGLDEASLPIPFPQMDVHVDGGLKSGAG